MIAHAFTVLVLKRSILTEKIARRGYHLSREYAVDPLEILFVREVMRPHPAAFTPESDRATYPVVAYPDEPLRVVVYRMAETGLTHLPVINRGDEAALVGLVELRNLLSARTRNLAAERDRERVLRIRLPLLRRNGSADRR